MFKVSPTDFSSLPPWKQTSLKKDAGLFWWTECTFVMILRVSCISRDYSILLSVQLQIQVVYSENSCRGKIGRPSLNPNA